MPTNKFKATLRLDENLYERLRVIAKEENRSINNLLERWIKREAEEYEKVHALYNNNNRPY